VIRAERPDDEAAIYAVHRAAFGSDLEPRMVEEVRATDGFIPQLSLVATSGNQVAGHVLVSWFALEGSERRLLQLGPIGVLPELQRQGIGSALVHAALDGARALGEPLVLLEGNPAYYSRFGFVRAHELGLLPPEGTPDGAFQVAVLDDGAELPRGRVRYPPAFTH
jgi:putative acetyltransferase